MTSKQSSNLPKLETHQSPLQSSTISFSTERLPSKVKPHSHQCFMPPHITHTSLLSVSTTSQQTEELAFLIQQLCQLPDQPKQQQHTSSKPYLGSCQACGTQGHTVKQCPMFWIVSQPTSGFSSQQGSS